MSASVAIVCSTNSYTVSGTVSGLAGGGVELQNNDGNDLAVPGQRPLQLHHAGCERRWLMRSQVKTQPGGPAQTCTVNSGSGTVADANVGDVVVVCSINSYTVSGTVSGLAGGFGLVLQNNDGDDLPVSADGSFSFTTPSGEWGWLFS